jgi:pimeloyl-ACP methyl ester carboxylesterase
MEPVVLLHGLHSHPATFYPLERFLNKKGYLNTHAIRYNADQENLNLILNEVDEILSKKIDREDKIIVIGQSLGGLVANNLHKKGWKIKIGIYIGSPLHGAKLIRQVSNYVPEFIISWFRCPAWNILDGKEMEEEPPHDYHTISMGWWDSTFDARVYKEETILDPEKHTHLENEDHGFVFLKPRLWGLVYRLIQTREIDLENKNEVQLSN